MKPNTHTMTAESLATVIRETDLKIRDLRTLNMKWKKRLGQLVAEARTRKGLSQVSAGPVLKAGGVLPCNITGIEKPSARRSYSVVMMMRAFRAIENHKP